MMKQKVYIRSLAQISIQEPLCEDWMSQPILYKEPYVRSREPNFREFINPMDARRMGKILKRALTTSLCVIKDSTIEHPDAIITGTGLGCIENTELFLHALCHDGEHLLKPTPFMQSTHNTISSLIAIHTKCHGYNTTYSHRDISFESALLDAMLQFQLGKIQSALVGSHDEITPSWYELIKKAGLPNPLYGETSVSFMLTSQKENSWCEVADCQIIHTSSRVKLQKAYEVMLINNELEQNDLDAIMTDEGPLTQTFFGNIPVLHYKHLFGESFSASGLGFYAAACCLKQKNIPSQLFYHPSGSPVKRFQNILFVGQGQNNNYSLILLKAS